jgi:hypothetical protein
MTARLALIALVAATVAALSAGPAAAGEYPVYACEPAFGDVNHSWTPEATNPRMAAYANCPVPWNESRVWNEGLVTRPSVLAPGAPPASVPFFAYSALRLRAPPGAGLARITYSHTFCGGASYQAGLIDDAGHWLHASSPGSCGTLLPSPWTLSLNGTPSIALATTCVKTTCPLDTKQTSWATMRSATVWISDSTPPSVSITGGSLTTPGWHRATQSVTVDAHDNVGVQHVDVYLDHAEAGSRDALCDWTLVVPCSTPSAGFTVDSRLVTDGPHSLVARGEDSAGNWATSARRILVDNTAPVGPLDPRVVGGDGWRQTNSFAVAWSNPSQADFSPVTSANYAICPASNSVDDLSGCATGSRSGSDISAVTGLRVPTPGDWVARVWLRDAAGNTDERSARSLHLRYDPDAPAVSMLSRDPSDPQQVTVVASDALSGLASVEVEIQRTGDDTWISLSVTASGSSFGARIDDASLPAGRYQLRARAIDRAGNERTTSARGTAAHAVVDLPLRLRTALVLGGIRRLHDRRGHARTVLRRSRTVDYGRSVPIRGRLTLPGPNALADAALDIFEQVAVPGATWRRIGMARTDGKGQFAYRARPGPSRLLRFAYSGTPLVQPRSGDVRVRVRARTSFRVSRDHVVNGDDVVFSGRVGGQVPSTGKLLELQAYSRGSWRTFATPRAGAASHRWRFDYRFTATRGVVRYRFRAVVPTEQGFPYARGVSRKLHVTVRGV